MGVLRLERRLTRNTGSDHVARARGLPHAMSPSEKKLWYDGLNEHQLGFHFRKQHTLGHYYLDFYAAGPKVAVELDGASHEDRADHDEARDRALASSGILTLRFMNGELSLSWWDVLSRIQRACYERRGGFEYQPATVYFESAEPLVVKPKRSAGGPPPSPPPTRSSQGEAPDATVSHGEAPE